MSILRSTTLIKTAAVATDTPMLGPEQVVEQLRTMRQQIPEFVQLSKRDRDQVRRLARLNVEFSHEAINAIGVSNTVQSVIGDTPDELRQAEDEASRWSSVESELRSMLRGVSAANMVRRERLARAALQTYNVSKQLVKLEEHANLLPLVENMSRIRKFVRRRVKAAEPQPLPAPPPTRPS